MVSGGFWVKASRNHLFGGTGSLLEFALLTRALDVQKRIWPAELLPGNSGSVHHTAYANSKGLEKLNWCNIKIKDKKNAYFRNKTKEQEKVQTKTTRSLVTQRSSQTT